MNKTNRCTEFQFYWYYDSTCFGQPFCPSSGVLSHTSALVHFVQVWWPFATRSRMQSHPTLGSKRSSQLHKMYQSRCTVKNSWWWAERLPKTCRVVIPIKLEFSASVGFIHKEHPGVWHIVCRTFYIYVDGNTVFCLAQFTSYGMKLSVWALISACFFVLPWWNQSEVL